MVFSHRTEYRWFESVFKIEKKENYKKSGQSKRYKFHPSLCLNPQLKKRLYVSTQQLSSYSCDKHVWNKYHLIPYMINKNIVSFAPITSTQLNEIMKEYKNHGKLTKNEYICILDRFLKDNSVSVYVMLSISHEENSNGFLITMSTNQSQSMDALLLQKTDIENIMMTHTDQSCIDFELNYNLISLFRGYLWPFEKVLNNMHLQLLQDTFPKKGLLRKCTQHNGNFEMIGKRRSKQSTGTMFSLQENVHEHQYYRESMNVNLLPYVKSIINMLQEEALYANYTSGECLMTLYRQLLGLRNLKDLCEQTIVTQNNFHNTVHIDKQSILNSDETKKVLKHSRLGKSKSEEANSYMHRMVQFTGGKLPKSTTCCWSLRCNSNTYRHIQYFFIVDHSIAYNISSDKLRNKQNVGATFMSSLIHHCTSIPIWVDDLEYIHLVGPENMYNFAWGSDGGSCKRN